MSEKSKDLFKKSPTKSPNMMKTNSPNKHSNKSPKSNNSTFKNSPSKSNKDLIFTSKLIPEDYYWDEASSTSSPSPESHHNHNKHSHHQDEVNYNYSENKYDCCAFIIFCPIHQQVAVSKSKLTNIVWLPFTKLPMGIPWKEGSTQGIEKILTKNLKDLLKKQFKINPPFDSGKLLQLFRIQMPCTMKFITRLIYYFQLNQFNKNFKCCENTERIEWLEFKKILDCQLFDDGSILWGPELMEFCQWINNDDQQQQQQQSTQPIQQSTAATTTTTPIPIQPIQPQPIFQQVLEYGLEEAFFFLPRDPPRNLEEAILKSAHISEKDVERLYSDFLDHCFPSFYLTLDSFKCYMEKYGFEKCDQRLKLLFNAFNFNLNGFLTFHELLLGLATIEPNTVHGEWRAKFIFRYYDQQAKGYLFLEEFYKIICDLNPGLPPDQLDFKLQQAIESIGWKMEPPSDGKKKIFCADFIEAIGAHRFRGTSNLCRSTKPIFTQISRTIAARSIRNLTKKHKIGTALIKKFKGKCSTCKEKQFQLATHTVRLNSESGFMEDPQLLIDIEEQDSSTRIFAKRYSLEFIFNEQSAANLMLKFIREFNESKGTNKLPRGLLQDNVPLLIKLINSINSDMLTILNEETKLLHINSPCFVFGDIHGNLEDLLSLEKILWKRLPIISTNYLFLGDYVDRGQWGLEISLYLFSIKILCPNNIFLLRGNHEVRTLQRNYTFHKECLDKYGLINGERIWELVNKIFDFLPICAIIDDSIFCSHGGIPKSLEYLKQIEKIPKKLTDPEEESISAWEILWNDPCNDQQFFEMCNFLKLDYKETNGFLMNIKRGTGYLFNEFGATTFLQKNGLTHIIRAHEVPQLGFQLNFGCLCCTIFSCSHYCGNNNNCACILVDDQVIRIITIDTVNNLPATE